MSKRVPYGVAPPSSWPPSRTSRAGRTGPRRWPGCILRFLGLSLLLGRKRESTGSWHQGRFAGDSETPPLGVPLFE